MSRRTSPQTSPALLATCLIALGGCVDGCGNGSFSPPLPGPGELGRGEFHYRCIGAGDPACPLGETVASFPSRVALGGRFELDYTWNDDDGQPLPTLRSSAPERLRVQGETFTALAYGYTAVLAVLPDSSVGDLIHLHVSEPVALALQHDGVDVRAYALGEGDELRLDVRPRDDERYELAGLLEYEFAVDDPSVVEIVGTGDAHVVVRARSEGAAVLRASLGALTTELTFTVGSGPATTTGDTTDSTGDSTDTTDSTGDSTGDSNDTDTDTDTDTTGGAP